MAQKYRKVEQRQTDPFQLGPVNLQITELARLLASELQAMIAKESVILSEIVCAQMCIELLPCEK